MVDRGDCTPRLNDVEWKLEPMTFDSAKTYQSALCKEVFRCCFQRKKMDN